MKISLKEFFLREAEEPVDEKALSSYKHPRTHLHSKFSQNPDIENPWALAQSIASKNEHTDPTCKTNDQGSSIWSDPENPADVRKFSNKDGNLHVDIKEMFQLGEMGGPGSGRKKGSKNRPKAQGPIIHKKAADLGSLPDELPADDFGAQDDSPFARSAGDTGGEDDGGYVDHTGDDLAWLDDPNLGAGTHVPTKADAPPAPKKAPAAPPPDDSGFASDPPESPQDWGQFFTNVEDDEGEAWSWKEFMKVDPPVAKSIAQEFPDVKDSGYFFTKDKEGDVVMRTRRGARYKWDAMAKDWVPMDEGDWPAP